MGLYEKIDTGPKKMCAFIRRGFVGVYLEEKEFKGSLGFIFICSP